MDNSITTLEMCAGYGGIGLGLKNIFGKQLRTIAYCELEGFAQANLISKMEAGLLDVAPLWNDLKTFPYAEFHGMVDILIAGYPCQPFSAAGKRAGKEDPRHLWPWIADGIRLLQPRLCFFENVEGHISLGLREVVGELESIGYKAAWGIFSASEVGAPHQRKRVFILAVSNSLGGAAGLSRSLAWNEGIAGVADHGGGEGGSGLEDADNRGHGHGSTHGLGRIEAGPQSLQQERQGDGHRSKPPDGHCSTPAWPSRPGEPQHGWEPPRVVGAGMAHTHGGRGEEPEHQQANLPSEPSRGCAEAMGNATSEGLSVSGRKRASVGESRPKQESKRPDKATSDRGLADSIQRRSDGRPNGISGRLGQSSQDEATDGRRDELKTQQPMGDPAYGTPAGLGVAELSGLSDQELAEIRHWMVASDNRTDELRLLGNGVVPATAERAFLTLWEELLKGTN